MLFLLLPLIVVGSGGMMLYHLLGMAEQNKRLQMKRKRDPSFLARIVSKSEENKNVKIAVTSQNKHSVTGHAGKCTKFWVYKIADGEEKISKELVELNREQSFHSNGHSLPQPLDGIHALITGGMGPGLVKMLQELGIQTVITNKTNIDDAVQSFIQDGAIMAISQCDCQGH